jgi:ABC-type phosphate transport system substrate-binding protein
MISLLQEFSAALLTLPLASSDAAAPPSASQSVNIRIGGSSTVFPILKAAVRSCRPAGSDTPVDLKPGAHGLRQQSHPLHRAAACL